MVVIKNVCWTGAPGKQSTCFGTGNLPAWPHQKWLQQTRLDVDAATFSVLQNGQIKIIAISDLGCRRQGSFDVILQEEGTGC